MLPENDLFTRNDQEPMDTIFVKSVKYQGPAVVAGLNIGDRIVSVNGEKVNGRSYAQVVQMIQKSRDSLFLEVVAKQDDLLQVVRQFCTRAGI